MKSAFGEFVRRLRAEKRLGLREFCFAAKYDPSNWSKIERGLLSPPQEEETLSRIAAALGMSQGSEQWNTLRDYAAIGAGKLPDYVMNDEELLEKLPVFFRTMTGKKPKREDLEKLVDILRER